MSKINDEKNLKKDKKKKIIEQRFNNQNELARLKVELKDTVQKINKKIKKARIYEKTLKQQIQNEKVDFRNNEKVENKKMQERLSANKKVIIENKKLILDQKRNLSKEVSLLKQENRNKIIEANRRTHFELKDLKEKIKNEKINQKSRILDVKKKIFEEKLKLKKELEEERNENNEIVLTAKNNIRKKSTELLEKKQEFIAKKDEARLKSHSVRMARIFKAKAQKEEMRRKRLEEKNKIKDKIIELKINGFEEISSEVENIKELKLNLENSKQEKSEKIKELNDEIVNVEKNSVKSLEEDITNLNKDFNDDFPTFANNENILESEFYIESTEKIEQKNYFKGTIINEVGKSGLKLYEKFNKKETKLKIEKIKLSKEKISLIEEMKSLKETESIIDIREFIKYVSFITEEWKDKDQINLFIISTLVNILRGKALAFLNGYFKLINTNGYKWITFSKNLSVSNFNVVSIPESSYAKEFEKILKSKLKDGAVVKISNNIAIKLRENEIIVLHDIGFLR